MNRTLLTAAICVGLTAQAEAAEHRLAFSKNAELEVFVEHADGQPWCSDELTLRFQGNGASRAETVSQIMPKLGALIGRECSQAKSARWSSINAAGTRIASGETHANHQWQLEVSTGYGEKAAPAAAPQPTETSEIAGVEQEQQPPVDKPAPQTMASEQEAPASDTPSQATAEADPVTTAAPEPTADTVATAKPAPETAEAAAEPQADSRQTPNTDFSINGWHPSPGSEAIQETTFSTPIKDQNGCILNTSYQLRTGAEFIRGRSEKLHCNAQGMVEGEGTFTILRTDGQQLGKISAIFKQGIPFLEGKPDFEIQKITEHRLYAYIGADAVNRVHYLLEIPHNNRGVWNLRQATLLALTDNEALFRNVQHIETVIRRGTELLPEINNRYSITSNFIALSSLDKRFAGDLYNKDDWLYSIRVTRSRRNLQWSFNLQKAKNYLFEREYRQAQQAKREQERARRQQIQKLKRQARAEAFNLRRYEELTQVSPIDRRNRWIKEVGYSFLDSSAYTRLLQGDERKWQQVVHLDDKEGDVWTVDQPYAAELSSQQELSSGWYQVTGSLRLDSSRTDSEGLPLTLINASQMRPCSDRQCLENFDPISIMRETLHDPQWDPQQAQALVDQVNKGEFD